MRGENPVFVPLDCRRCALAAGRQQVVPAEGGERPIAFFVGEAPGPEEDAQGRPFVGRAGRILRRALAGAGWRDEELWITNAVKCFPNDRVGEKRRIRKPAGPEVDACRRHLAAEVAALRPRLIVTLGATALEAVTGRRFARLGAVRASLLPARDEFGSTPVFPTYHPSGLHYGHATPEEFQDDLRRARALAERGT